jgi:hypothetical protein
MVIDPKIEQPTRKMLGHAIRGELADLAALAREEGTETLMRAIPLCLFASGYIAIDVADHWPTDADLRKIARNASQSATELDISEQEIYEYLSRVALGPEKLDDVLSVEALATIPLYATANLLLTFAPSEMHWWEYLDQIWDAAETAERTSLTVLPALMLRARQQSAPQDNPTSTHGATS